MTHAPLLELHRDGAVCTITLRRERKLNALSTELERQLGAAIRGPEVAQARAIVVTGGARSFSAGADVKELRARDPESVLGYYRETGEVYEQIAALEQPTFSAIAGYCLGAGLELALVTDFRIADETATFGFPEVGLGIVPSSGGIHRLVRLLGPARAKELVLLGERISASEALALGLVSEVVPAGEAHGRAGELAKHVAHRPMLALTLAKQAIDRMPDASREAGILIERLAYGLLAQTRDAREATAAFHEQPEPAEGPDGPP
jgi:enoyl-CoA hydratase/carnithine racemase